MDKELVISQFCNVVETKQAALELGCLVVAVGVPILTNK